VNGGEGECYGLCAEFCAFVGAAEQDSGGVTADYLFVVGHHQDGGLVVAVDGGEDVHDAVGCIDVEVAGGFVGKDYLGVVEQGSGDGDTLLLASGELVGELVGFAFEGDEAEDFVDATVDSFFVTPVCGAEHEAEVVFDCAFHKELEVLENDAHLAAKVGYLSVGDGQQVVAADLGFLADGTVFADYGPDYGCFAAADFACEVDELAFVDG